MAEDALVTMGATVLGGAIALLGSWGMMKIQENGKRREQRELVDKFRHVILCEIKSIMSNYIGWIGLSLEQAKEGEWVSEKFHINNESFIVFMNNTDMLMLIDDEERECVVSVYSSFNYLVDGYKKNNELLSKYEAITNKYDTSGEVGTGLILARSITRAELDLRMHRSTLIERHKSFVDNYDSLHRLLELQ